MWNICLLRVRRTYSVVYGKCLSLVSSVGRSELTTCSDIVMIVSKGVGQSGSRMCALRCIISSIIVPVDDSKPYRRTVMTHDIICYACAKKYSSSILGRVHIYKTGGTTNCSCIKKHHSASVRDSNRVAPIS